MLQNKLALKSATRALNGSRLHFLTFFTYGTLEVELYKPDKVDHQQPHDKDEVYIVVSGHGEFELEGQVITFETGDLLFAPARTVHRFVNFSDDFATWVLFYGPKGGEKGELSNSLQ